MFCGGFAFYDFGSGRSAGNGAFNRFFGRFVVVFLDLGIVFSRPVDENTDADEQIIGFIGRNGAVFYAIGNSHGNAALSRAEHLNCLFGAFNGYFIEHYCCRLNHQVRSNYSQQTGKTVFVVC